MKNKDWKFGSVRFFIFLILSFLCFSFSLTAESGVNNSSENTTAVSNSVSEKNVRVGCLGAPFFITDKNGNMSGYAYDYLQDVAAYTGWSYSYVSGTWPELFEMLCNGEIDILANVSKMPGNNARFLFSKYPIGAVNYYVFKNVGEEKIDPLNYSSLNGKKVGLIENSFEEYLFGSWCKTNKISCSVLKCSSDYDLVHKMAFGEIDAIVGMDNYDWVAVDAAFSIGLSNFYVAFANGKSGLKEEFDAAHYNLLRINKYYNQDLNRKYLSATVNSSLSLAEFDWLNEHGAINVGYLEKEMAFCGVNEKTGDVDGLLKDYLNAAAFCFSNSNIDFNVTSFSSIQEMFAALKSRKIDCVFPVYTDRSFAEKNGFHASSFLFKSALVGATVKRAFNEYDKNTVVVCKNDLNLKQFIEVKYPDWDVLEVNSYKDCEKAVSSGDADLMLLSSYQLEHKIDAKRYSIVSLSKDIKMGFVVNRGDSQLLSVLNHSIALIPESTINASLSYYSSHDHKTTFGEFIKDNLLGTLVVLVVVIWSLIIVFLFVRKFVVAEQKTSSLNEELQKNLHKINENYQVIRSLGQTYTSSFYIDMKTDTFIMLNSCYKEISSQIGVRGFAQEKLNHMCNYMIAPENDMEKVKAFVDLSTLNERLKNKQYLTVQYLGLISGWVEGYMIAGDRDEFGNLNHVIWAMRDINEQKKAELEQKDALKLAVSNAESANRAKTVFLNSMSHDIRTPMNAIIGFTTLAYTHMDNKELLSDYLTKINISSNHLLSLINDVLDMSKIESGKVKFDDKVIHLPDVMNDLRTISTSEAEKKNIQFVIEYKTKNDNIYCDKLRLNQVLLNLISNAMKYTDNGGIVSLTVSQKRSVRRGYGLYEFRIKDNGIGMSSAFMKNLFKPFERERTVTASGVQGTGLGLSITKNLIDMMGGTIDVESKSGEGTTVIVCISFKICAEPIVPEPVTVKKLEKRDFTGKRLLLVEDNVLNQEIAAAILKESGFDVDIAEDGDIAVEIMRKASPEKYDLILMDIQMPKMDGYTATREIRTLSNPQIANIPIVAMTANAFDSDKVKAIKAGMNAHVAKPIDIDLLLNTLNTYIK